MDPRRNALLVLGLAAVPVEGQSSNMEIVILPDQIIIVVVIAVILLGMCCGILAVLWRNRSDVALLLPAWMSCRRTPKVEEATEADRIAFEKAELRKQKRELRQAAEALDEEEGGGTYLDLPNTLPSTLDKPSSDMDSADTSIPLPGSKLSAATDSGGSARYARGAGRRGCHGIGSAGAMEASSPGEAR
eukprot:Skav200913  [mRNA]  locus=scaffold2433:13451:18615:+ [translate_table: standard]